MNETGSERSEEIAGEKHTPPQKTSLEDLQPTVDVTGGLDHKATDVTLKRGVIG